MKSIKKQNMKKAFVITLLIGLTSMMFGAVFAEARIQEIKETSSVFPDSEFEDNFNSVDTAFCHEIVHMLEENGVNVDYDAIDIDTLEQVEELAINELGSYYFDWRYNQSVYATEFDALIYRYCY